MSTVNDATCSAEGRTVAFVDHEPQVERPVLCGAAAAEMRWEPAPSRMNAVAALACRLLDDREAAAEIVRGMFVEDGSRPLGGTEAALTDVGLALVADPTFKPATWSRSGAVRQRRVRLR
jgi:hypothetical protein